MDTYFYICPRCGFVYQIPSYWSNHSPDKTIEFLHIDLKTKDACSELILQLSQESQK